MTYKTRFRTKTVIVLPCFGLKSLPLPLFYWMKPLCHLLVTVTDTLGRFNKPTVFLQFYVRGHQTLACGSKTSTQAPTFLGIFVMYFERAFRKTMFKQILITFFSVVFLLKRKEDIRWFLKRVSWFESRLTRNVNNKCAWDFANSEKGFVPIFFGNWGFRYRISSPERKYRCPQSKTTFHFFSLSS